MYSTLSYFIFFTDTATTEIYTLSLHDALPICGRRSFHVTAFDTDCMRFARGHPTGDGKTRDSADRRQCLAAEAERIDMRKIDRKSTRLNSSHPSISYAVFCLKKKKKNIT